MKKPFVLYSAVFPCLFFLFPFFSCSRAPDSLGLHSKKFWKSSKTALLARALSPQTHAVWSTGSHTAAPVPLGALGPEKYLKSLRGIIQNTAIAEVTQQAVADGMGVVVVIGDGMGVMHLSLPVYLNIARQNRETTGFEKIMNEGSTALCLTNAADELVTCSAASATAFACGVKTRQGVLGLDTNGYPVESVLELAEKTGRSTGLITDTRLTHATPAGFYAKILDRDREADIASQLLNHRIDLLFGGGAIYFIPQGTTTQSHPLLRGMNPALGDSSARKDSLDLVREMAGRGYAVISSARELTSLNDRTRKILGLFAGSGMNAPIDRDDENTGEPSIPAMTEKALEILSRNPKGFYLMTECGQIDWAAHGNDAGAVLKAMEEMDEVLKVCHRFWSGGKDKRLVIFTADHETGGLGFSYTFRDSLIGRELPSGGHWTSDIDGLPLSAFLNLDTQKKSLARMAAGASSAAALKAAVEANSSYFLSTSDAEAVLKAK